MRKSKKSVHVEAIALSLFIVALVVYASFFTVGSTVQAGNAECGASWDTHKNSVACKKQCGGGTQSTPPPEACLKQCADQKNGAERCIDQEGTTGFCDAVQGSQSPKKVCRGDQDKNGKKASDEGKKKAEDAMKDKGGGGGEPPKMPEIPKKEPKKEEPKQEQKPCPTQHPIFGQGEQTTVSGTTTNSPSGQQQFDQYGRPCPTENAPANFLSQLRDSLLKAFSETFTPLTSSDLEGLTPEEQLQKISDLINGNPTIADSEKPARIVATDKLVTEYEKGGYEGTIEKAVEHANLMTVDQINNTTTDVGDDLRTLAQSQSADLIPSTGSVSINPESSTNIVTSVSNWLKSWFGF